MKSTLMNIKNMKNNEIGRFYKKFFGIRILKTAVATTMAIFIAQLISLHNPMMAGFAAIKTIQSSIFDTRKAMIDRLLSTILGAIVASSFHFVGFVGYIPMFLGIILIINVCNYFKWKDATTLALMVFVIVMAHTPKAPDYLTYWEYGINRTIDTIIGLVIGFLINYFILPPDRSEFILKTYQKSLKESEIALKEILKGHKVNMAALISDVELLSNELKNIRRDEKLALKLNVKDYPIAKLNQKFYTIFGIIAQFADETKVPILSESNMMALKEYFGDDIIIDTGNFNFEFETAFNYYLDELVVLLDDVRSSIEDLRKNIEKNKDSESL